MSRVGTFLWAALAAVALWSAPARAHEPGQQDTIFFAPEPGAPVAETPEEEQPGPDRWLRAPIGDRMLTDPEEWESRTERTWRVDGLFDYNRVDPVRLGAAWQAQAPNTLIPRIAARLEYATARERWLYGIQVEQPLLPRGVVAVGVSMVRRTDHSELHQVDDVENSLALLFGRQDYRDYFEREGFGVYVAARVPGLTTVSLHARNDDYRSIPLYRTTRSWFQRDRDLRDNPPIDEAEIHAGVLRLERLAHQTAATRAGFYHWAELELAGGALGGDRFYTRMLADARSVLRLSPASTLMLRLVGGHTPGGRLPPQKHFTAGGVDGLRAHPFSSDRGDELLLAQAEYAVELWRLRTRGISGNLHALVFLDAGRAWFNPDHHWDLNRQQVHADGGFGLATSEDRLRVYFARDLQDRDADFVISVRLQRPF